MSIFIRKMQPEDFAGILPLQHEIQALHEEGRPDLFRPGAVSYPEEIFREILSNPDGRCAVCESEGRIVGFLFAWVRRLRGHRNLNDGDVLFIDDICVARDFRRRGAGKALFDYAQAAAKTAGCVRVELSVYRFNENAVGFYEAMGFVPQIIRMEKRMEAISND